MAVCEKAGVVGMVQTLKIGCGRHFLLERRAKQQVAGGQATGPLPMARISFVCVLFWSGGAPLGFGGHEPGAARPQLCLLCEEDGVQGVAVTTVPAGQKEDTKFLTG